MNTMDNRKRHHRSVSEPPCVSEPFADVFAPFEPTIKMVAPLKIDLVLEGETGTGKDTLARRIHQLSGRSGKLVAVNCAAIPETLAESELFGVHSGAYTGASKARAGYVEEAHNGTLFLDEIDSMSLSLQAKMLRVLENRGVERLGGTQFTAVDMRVIVATQKPLLTLVEEGSFRRDLYFRLNTVSIQLQPLREQTDLIEPMFEHFCRQYATLVGHNLPPLKQHQHEDLLSYNWPGNFRELKAAAQRFVLGLPLLITQGQYRPGAVRLKERLQRIEKSLIKSCLMKHDHSVDHAAQELGMHPRTLYHRIKLLNVASRENEEVNKLSDNRELLN